MSDATGDASTGPIRAVQRAAELEIEIARLEAELDEARGGDVVGAASRFLAMAAATIDQAITEVSTEADAAVARATTEIEQQKTEAASETAAARAEAEAARAAAAQVTIGARRELERTRTSAAAMAESAAAAAEETHRNAQAEAERIVGAARKEASKALVAERQRFAREVDALDGVREALIKERHTLEQYHGQLQARVRDLAEAMVAFMTNGSDDESLDALAQLTRPEIEPPPENRIGPELTSLTDADRPILSAVSEPEPDPSLSAAGDPESVGSGADDEESEPEPAAVLVDQAADDGGDEVTDEGYPQESYDATFEASTAIAAEQNATDQTASEPVDSEAVDSEPVDSDQTESEPVDSEPVESEPVDSDTADADAADEPATRPEDLFSDSFGFGNPDPSPKRPVVEVIPPQSDDEREGAHDSGSLVDADADTGVHPASTGEEHAPNRLFNRAEDTVSSSPSGPSAPREDPWREIDPSEPPVSSKPLFGTPIEPSVLVAARDSDSDLFGPARPGEGTRTEPASLGRLFAEGADRLTRSSDSDESGFPMSDDSRFQDFIDGDDDDASRSWLLRND